MREIRPFLGTTNIFSKAYPEIEQIKVTVNQDVFGYHIQNKNYREKHYSEKCMSSKVTCPNPLCKGGGLDIDSYLRIMVMQKQRESKQKIGCDGDEGSPQGRRRGRPCDNFFEIEVKIDYQAETGDG